MKDKATTVRELIEQLQAYPPEARVVATFESIFSGFVGVRGVDTLGRVVLDVDDESGGNQVPYADVRS